MGVPGVIVANSDGTANIFINTLYSLERQRETIQHELRHLARQHQFCDWKTIEEKETEAGEENPSYIFAEDFSFVEYIERQPAKTEVQEIPILHDVFKEAKPNMIPYFASLDVLRDYMLAMREQYRRMRQ